MKPTSAPFLVTLGILGVALGLGLTWIVGGQTGRALAVPGLSAAALWLLAIGVASWAAFMGPRLRKAPGTTPVPPLAAARAAVLGMAASRMGALVAGIYLGIMGGTWSAVDTPAGLATVTVSGVSAAGALGVVAAGLWLERLCRLPNDDDDVRR